MSQPGWYPDPEGRRGHYRYWDGVRWGISTTRAPGAPDPKKPNFPLVTLVVIVGLVTFALIVWFAVDRMAGPAEENATPTPIGTQDDGPLPPKSPAPSEGASPAGSTKPVDCPQLRPTEAAQSDPSRLISAGLSVAVPQGWQPALAPTSTQVTEQAGAWRTYEDSGWTSFIILGVVPRAEGFQTAQETALHVVDCHVTGGRFTGWTATKVHLSEATTIAGRPGWRVRAHATSTRAPGGGATFELVALDLDQPGGISVYWTGVVDADAEALAQAEATLAGLGVA